MFFTQKLKAASILYKYAYPLYRSMYFRFKKRKDLYNMRLIRKLVKPGSIILDIGANVGFYSKFLSDISGINGHVYCFEPESVNFHHLKNELKERNNVTLIQKAVASQSGKTTLFTSNLINVDHRTYEPESYSDKYTVDKISIDAFIDNKFEVDFIKMDIQGFETDALNGMSKTLNANKDVILFMELWPYGLQQAGSSANEVYELLTKQGFKIYNVNDDQVSILTKQDAAALKVEVFSDTNILVTRKNLLK